MKPNLGLTAAEIAVSTQNLIQLLADTYLIYLKSQKYHWHVVDQNFWALHEFFGNHYETLAKAIDEIAERCRILDQLAPAKFSEFLKLTSLSEETSEKSSNDMLKSLLHDHEKIIHNLRRAIKELNDSSDEGTKDFFIKRLGDHEKMAWMVRSHIII